ncbi:MAG: hypothetical protein K2Q20_06385 [Phycisphaerales bacterium]|nr:hypothetical protein [Phycisphaerales bacterium]
MVIIDAAGMLRFRLYLPHAQKVELTGDFNQWSPGSHAMRCDESMQEPGWWCAEFRLPAGEYRFAYLVNNSWWMPDYAAHGVERNGAGKWVSLLRVAGPAPVALPKTRPVAASRPIPGRFAGEREATPVRLRRIAFRDVDATQVPTCGHPHAG